MLQLDKPRPALVLSVDPLNRHASDVCVVGMTAKAHRKFSMRVLIKASEGGLNFDCWAKCDQVTTVEKSLLQYPALGTVAAQTFSRIEQQVRIALGLL